MNDKAKQARDAMTAKDSKRPEATDASYLSTGVTLINLAAYGRINGGITKGHIYRLAGRSGAGKAQPLDCKVLTPSGWRLMGDLDVGDDIIDPDGGYSLVTGVFPQGTKEVFEVTLSDGTKTRCCEDHLWLIQTRYDRTVNEERVLPLFLIRNTMEKGLPVYVPFTKPVDYCWNKADRNELEIQPYLLGALLGNGFLGYDRVYFSSIEREIVDRMEAELPDRVEFVHKQKGDYGLSVKKGTSNPLLDSLRGLGLSGCLAHNKFIPRDYLLSTIEDRWQLLYGLMDTDGTVYEKTGYVEYSTSSKDLANDVAELVRSLGGRVYIYLKKEPKYSYRGEERIGRTHYRLSIRFGNDEVPFLLKRKANLCRTRDRGFSRHIESIELVGEELCQCISTSSKRELYVTDDFIVTHNTFIARTILAEACINPSFSEYELVYDDVERGALMDTEKFFGRKLVDRLVSPARAKDGSSVYSTSIMDFYKTLRSKLENGKKVIWVEDSLDSLVPETETKASDGKAKINSQEMRKLMEPLEATGSILVLISQVRANMQIRPGPMQWSAPEDVISGGRAPEFYSTFDLVLRKSKTLKVVYNQKKYTQGHLVAASITKNRLSGLNHVIYFPFYPTYGIDDIGANVRFLLECNHWVKDKQGRMICKEFDFEGTMDKLTKKVEDDGLQHKLQILVGRIWKEIAEACSTKRKPRYS